jgi:choline-sulfatase
MSRRPNILFIMADQLAPQFLPCYGHKLVQAPHIERLAREGVVFDAAYTNSPLCAPSRFVMMSGRLPAQIAAWDNAVDFSAEVPTFAHYLEAEGYRTCLSGKMHFVGPDQLHGFRRRLTTDVYPADYTWHPEWDRPGERLDWYHNMDVVLKAGPCMRSLYLDYDDEVLFEAKRFLFDEAREDSADPWMLTVSMIQPHDPYLCRPEKWELYRDEDIDLPSMPLGSVPEDPHSARLRHGYGATDEDFDEQTLRNARRAYYGAIGDVDDKVGELMQALAESGQADNTIVVLTADHGDMLGERGMWFKMSFLEHSARVPLIVHAPGMFTPRRVAEAVSHVDLLPTLAELARDGNAPDYATPIEGRSLLPHLQGTGGHDEAIGEYYGEGTQAPVLMLRRGEKKLIHCPTDPAQYYDLAADPAERSNLAEDPAHAETVANLQSELAARYDVAALTERVLESQRRRKFIKHIMRANGVAWDYQPLKDATQAYIRNSVPLYQIEKRGRFPRVP